MARPGQSEIGRRWPTLSAMADGCGPRRRSALAAWLLATTLLCGTVTRALAEEPCQPWPGEPTPLPTTAETDPALARWSELRVAELVARAQVAEARDPVESHRLWSRVLCIDSANELAWRGVDRTRLVRVYRPGVGWGWGRARAAAVADPWEGLAVTISVPRPASPSAAPPRPAPPRTVAAPAPAGEGRDSGAAERVRQRQQAALAEAQRMAASAESSLREARFEQALARADDARRLLDGLPGDELGSSLRARVEVLSATAHIALGDQDAARRSFSRALASDPGLRLDPMKTSPKVMQALNDARSEGAP